MTDYFGYNNGSDVIPKDTFRISPSQLSKFFDQTNQWYREHLLGEAGFQGSTATHLGNCVHAAAQMFIETGRVDNSAIVKYVNSITDPEVEKPIINEQHPYMINSLLDLIANTPITKPECELFAHAEVLPGVVAAGSIDMYSANNGGTITDWKTMGSLDKARLPAKFPRQYWFQQMTYAWILRQQGKPVSQCRLVYITRNNTGRFNDKGKPLKDYPSQTHILTEPVTDESMQIIEGVLKVVAESVLLWNSNPEYRHILAQDDRLRAPKKPKLFKKD
jgi:hypothetical protein